MKTKSKDMTTKPKTAKGLKPRVMWSDPNRVQLYPKQYLKHHEPVLVLDASDAGRDALAADLSKIINCWLFHSEENELPMNAILSRLGYRPAAAKKGRVAK